MSLSDHQPVSLATAEAMVSIRHYYIGQLTLLINVVSPDNLLVPEIWAEPGKKCNLTK